MHTHFVPVLMLCTLTIPTILGQLLTQVANFLYGVASGKLDVERQHRAVRARDDGDVKDNGHTVGLRGVSFEELHKLIPHLDHHCYNL